MKIFKTNKMILVVTTAIVLLSILPFFQSCNSKEDGGIQLIRDSQSIIKVSSNVFENPYEYVGKYHNEGLKAVFDNMKDTIRLKTDAEYRKDKAKKLTLDFCNKKSLNGVYIKEKISNSTFESVDKFNSKLSNTKFSENSQIYQNMFREIIRKPNGCKSISDVINKLKEIEQEIYCSGIDKNDKEALLVEYAIGRNSLEFWLSCKSTSTNSLQKSKRFKSGSNESSDSFLDWWNKTVTPAVVAVVESDFNSAAEGAVAGLTIGVLGGSVVPGAGTVTGAITGTVSGAATGAVYGSVIGGVKYYFTKQ